MREPLVVYFRDAVAARENQVDEKLPLPPAEGLAEPVRKCELCRDALLAERVGHDVPVRSADEQVEVLRVLADSGVANESERSTDEKVDVVALQDFDDAFVEFRRVAALGLDGCWCHDFLVAREMPSEGTYVAAHARMRIAATGDLHFGKASPGILQPLLSQITTGADVLLMAGDLTDYGTPDEARALVKDLAAAVRIPIVAVLGNHDFEAGAEREIHQIMVDHGVCMLDGDTCEVEGVGFAGVKGFAGGFGRRALGPGESRSSSSSCTRP